ncbi:hypothetical protein FRC10_005569 [Ceratobasidium sp. 414]|nr:hypothetical protein FRC10_005569 [Ceratobasidium sp. 414]
MAETAAFSAHNSTSGDDVQLSGPSETAPPQQASPYATPTSESIDPQKKFGNIFHQDHWNHPDKAYPDLDKALTKKRALVIAIHYDGPNLLPGMFADVYKITNMLGIVPVDWEALVLDKNDSAVDPRSVLSDLELNSCLAGAADVKFRFTALFDVRILLLELDDGIDKQDLLLELL